MYEPNMYHDYIIFLLILNDFLGREIIDFVFFDDGIVWLFEFSDIEVMRHVFV